MDRVPVTRAAHVIEFCNLFRRIGVPVERHLRLNKLPESIEEDPDILVNNIFATGFVGRTADAEGIADVGWLGARAFSESQLSTEILDAVGSEPTVFARLKRFMSLSSAEDTHLRMSMNALGRTVEVVSDMHIPEDTPGMSASNWAQIAVVIQVIRSVMGPRWAPARLAFKTDFPVSDDARMAFGNCQLITGAPNTAIYFPVEVLAERTSSTATLSVWQEGAVRAQTDLEWIKTLLRPYFSGATPSLARAAEILGTSSRTLQRRLGDHGTTYGKLVETTRFEMAADLLTQSDMRIIDVAASLGFEDQSNFGRMFRRHAGISPGAYRNLRESSPVLEVAAA